MCIRRSYRPQDWNLIEVNVKGDVAPFACNDEPLDFPWTLPATGSIGLGADRSLYDPNGDGRGVSASVRGEDPVR